MADETKATLGTADILEVMKLLPHRYPFLLIDKIIEIDGDSSAIGIKNVTVNEPHFTGHFPDRPIMPGVLIEIHVVKQRQRGNVFKFHCEAKVEGALVAEADVGAMMIPEGQ